MIPDQLSYTIEDKSETQAKHDQREDDQNNDDMLGVDEARLFLLQGEA